MELHSWLGSTGVLNLHLPSSRGLLVIQHVLQLRPVSCYNLNMVVLRVPVLSEHQSPVWGVFEVLGLELISVQLIT